MHPDAVELIDEAIDFAGDLGLGVTRLPTETTIVDVGIDAEGGYEAGLVLAELRYAGQVTADVRPRRLGDLTWPVVDVIADRPTEAIELAMPAIQLAEADITLTGPSLDGSTDPFAVIIAESTQPIGEEEAKAIADHLGVNPSSLYIAGVSPGHPTWCVYEAALSLLTLGEVFEAEGVLDHLEGALLRVPTTPPFTYETSPDTPCPRSLAGRAHLSLGESIDTQLLDRFVESIIAQVTCTTPDGTVHTQGSTDPEAFAEAIT